MFLSFINIFDTEMSFFVPPTTRYTQYNKTYRIKIDNFYFTTECGIKGQYLFTSAQLITQ